MSIPRAELNRVVLMSEIFTDVKNSLKKVYSFEKIVFWTDSTVVHAWVRNKNKTFENYLQTRLNKIRTSISDESLFLLVPSKLNPADISTRGLKPSKFSESKLWLEGPEFLKLQEKVWPNLNIGDKFNDYLTISAEEEDVNHTRLTSVAFSDVKNYNYNNNSVSSEYNVDRTFVDGEYNAN